MMIPSFYKAFNNLTDSVNCMVGAQPFFEAELFTVSRRKFTELLNKAIFNKFGYKGTNSYTPEIFVR